MTEAELRAAQRSYNRALSRTEELRMARDNAVHTALKDGWSHTRIAEATGLTRGRIGQLATRGQQ